MADKETNKDKESRKIVVKNMVCNCCIRIVRMELEAIGVEVPEIRLGEISIVFDPKEISFKQIEKCLNTNGFEIVEDKEKVLLEQVKHAVIDLVHHSTFNAMVRNSDYLVERFGVSYQYLSNLFSKAEGTTLEKYIIAQKIEKAKELIQAGDLTLSEIAYMMGYSSVQYLSTQFKSVTGISVSDFKRDPTPNRKSIDTL
jgi:AraC-like DNA-binding protein